MPLYRMRNVFQTLGVKAFLDLKAGITRGPLPDDTPGENQRALRQRLQKARREVAAKERELSEAEEKYALLDPKQREKRIRERYGPLQVPKRRVLEVAFRKHGVRSFADLGCTFQVNGGYSLYALDRLGAQEASMVDFNLKPSLLKIVESRNDAYTLQGNFGDESIAERIGQVEAVILFDVLLHQVSPDWDEILSLYAPRTKLFIVYNQQWIGSRETVRLLDLGAEEYRGNVPRVPQEKNEELYRKVLERPEEFDLWAERRNRDHPGIWQWGITDTDLIDRMDSLGFSLRYYEDNGHFQNLENFRNRAFVFESQIQEAGSS